MSSPHCSPDPDWRNGVAVSQVVMEQLPSMHTGPCDRCCPFRWPIGSFICKFCPRSFPTGYGLGNHVCVHRRQAFADGMVCLPSPHPPAPWSPPALISEDQGKNEFEHDEDPHGVFRFIVGKGGGGTLELGSVDEDVEYSEPVGPCMFIAPEVLRCFLSGSCSSGGTGRAEFPESEQHFKREALDLDRHQ